MTCDVPGGRGWRRVRRCGIVHARRLDEAAPWRRSNGEELRGEAGDWLLWDEDPQRPWTVKPDDFTAGHERLGVDDADGVGRYLRVGEARARPAVAGEHVRTAEGHSTAAAGDWLVESPEGRRWFVNEATLRSRYEVDTPPDLVV